MSEEKTKLEWQNAIAEFSKISDGFWIMGYHNGGNQKFAYGLAEDPALDDALALPQITALEWATENNFNEESE